MSALRFLSALLLAAALVAGGALWLQRQAAAELQSEVALLRDQQAELARLRAENERLTAAQVPAAKLDAMRADHAAIGRLRQEVGALDAGLKQKLAALTPPGPAVRPLPPFANEGKLTARAAAQTVGWAINGGDPDLLANTLMFTAPGRGLAQAAFDRLPADRRAAYGTPERMMAELLCATTPSTGADRVSTEEIPGVQGAVGLPPSSDPGFTTLHTVTRDATGHERESDQVFESTPDGWRWVVSPGLVTKRLVETGLMPVPTAKPAAPGGN
jgi:hypothetical protein